MRTDDEAIESKLLGIRVENASVPDVTVSMEVVRDDAPVIDPEAAAAAEAVEAEFASTDLMGMVVDDEALARLYRYVRVRLRLEEERARLEEQAKAMKREVDLRLKGLEVVHGLFCAGLVKAKLAKDGAGKKKPKKSFKTPFGTVGVRASQMKVEVVELDKFLAWVDADDKRKVMVKTERKPVMEPIKAMVTDSGEEPDGCEVIPASDSFYVKGPKAAAGGDDE